MEKKMQHAEELVREFLVFRGFTNTLESYDAELRTDIGKGFEVDKILDLIFSLYVPKFHADSLLALLGFFKHYLSSSSDSPLLSTLSKLETSLLRFYVVHAVQCNRNDKVVDFFALYGAELLQSSQDWTHWFAIPYKKNPHLDPEFRVFFSKEWYQALHLSSRNFFSEVSSEMNATNLLKRDIVHLNLKLSQLQALLDEKEAQLRQFRSMEGGSTGSSSNLREETARVSKDSSELFPTGIPQVGQTEISQDSVAGGLGNIRSELIGSTSGNDSTTFLSNDRMRNGRADNATLKDNNGEVFGEEDFAEVKVEYQETFLGHTGPISRCCFSASGNNIASASLDGTVRIWTYDTSTPVSRNATIYCGTEILSLDWECTSDGCIKAWNVDAKRVVCDLNTTEAFPSVLDIKCSPVEPIFVSAAASGGAGSNYIDNLGFASLTVWNMKTWKAMTVLPLGEDPPAITSLCFNHNGKILAASAIFEWSLQNQGQILWSRDSSRFCYPFNDSKYCRHEMALDANGRRLLVTSSSFRAPIYQVHGHLSGWRTLPHGAPITAVDWHPTLPIFLTGSADNSVRVTSLS
ncbi:WD repeat-containing protein 91 [Glycine max]|nr:WD repeat-containing protein 91 [Glycine max]